MLFDAHAHLNDDSYTEEDRRAVAAAIEASDVGYVADAGSDLKSSLLSVMDAETYPWCYATVGCHPHDTKDLTEEILLKLRELTADPKVVAYGEIGLDFHYDISERDIQRKWFARQIRLANELRMPMVIHSREAEQETMRILTDNGAFSDERKSWFPPRKGPDGESLPDARVLIHCFSGSAETALQYVKLGATISICGPVTFKSNKKTRAVAERVPLEFLTVETDSPFLSPEPVRGKPNNSTNVKYVAAKVAEIKGLPEETVADATCANALRFYGITPC